MGREFSFSLVISTPYQYFGYQITYQFFLFYLILIITKLSPYELCEKGIFLVHEELMVDNVVVLSKSVYHPPYYNYYFNSQFYQEWFYKAQYIHPLNKNIREL